MNGHANAADPCEEHNPMSMAQQATRWTLARLNALPEDGNRYELVRGELLVSPPPSVAHESICDVLHRRLYRYVEDNDLGRVSGPRAVIQRSGSQTEPDLTVRPITRPLPKSWAQMPNPILVVEVLSPSTRRNDEEKKRRFYLDIEIPEYWIVDGDQRSIRVIRPGEGDLLAGDAVRWHPTGATDPLIIDVQAMFREALG
jgi:Uma2 family endonuclease